MAYQNNSQRPVWRLTSRERQLLLFIGDLISVVLALFVALYFWAQKDQWMDFSWQFLRERPPGWYYAMPIMWMVLMLELYDVSRSSRQRDTIQGIATAAAIATGLYLIIFFFSEPNTLPRRGVAGFIAAVTVLTFVWRMIYLKTFTAPAFMRRVLIIGAGRAGSTLAEIINEMNPQPFILVGFVDDDPMKKGKQIHSLPVLGGSKQLLKIVNEEHITDLIFSISGEMKPEMFKTILVAEEKGIEMTTMPVVYEDLLGRVPIFLLEDDWLVRTFFDQAHSNAINEFLKRFVDILGALTGLILLILFAPLISLLILIDSGFPILYRQNRLGKNGKLFELLKFRTMVKDAEKDGQALLAQENDQRITRIGRLLRRSHLDELPQFINVLRGDISLVGPRAERPELVDKLQKKIPFYRARLFVNPGMTGWAQINYRYATNVRETAIKLEHDLYYIKNRNLLLDLMIIFRTLLAVIRFQGL